MVAYVDMERRSCAPASTAPWTRWSSADEAYLREHQADSNEAIAAVLRRDPDAIKRKRYALRLLRTPENAAEIRRAARARGEDVWPATQDNVIHTHFRKLAAVFGPKKAIEGLKPLIDQEGPVRTLSAIQLRCSKLIGQVEAPEQRDRRLANIRPKAALAKLALRQIPHTLGWVDLSPLTRTVILFSVLGDASLPKAGAGSHHYYTETHELPHRDYLLWKRNMLPGCFAGKFREDPAEKKDPRCVWETGVSQIFSTLRPHLYPQIDKGYKSIISEWVIEQIEALGDLALLGLLIWLLDDGRNAMKDGYPNLEICIERWEFRLDDVQRVCDFYNRKFSLTLRVRPGHGSNTLVIPATDRDRLMPIWWKYADDYGLPDCMRYKIPAYNQPTNGSRRLNWEQKFDKDEYGLKVIVENPVRVSLVKQAYALHGTSLIGNARFLAQQGHPITPRYLRGVWSRLSIYPPSPPSQRQ